MRCKECKRFLKYHFYDIAGRKICSSCAMELGLIISEFKVIIPSNERRF